MCECVNVTPGCQKGVKQQILVDIPSHMGSYRSARVREGLSDKLAIDPCVLMEIQELWSKGIVTYGCCCGHNILPSFVSVDDLCIDDMVNMGYTQYHTDKSRKDTFRLKSC